MKKTFLLPVLLCLLSFNANAFIFSPYVGADYNYTTINYGKQADDFYADKLNSFGVTAGVKVLSWISAEAFYQQSENKEHSVSNYFVTGDKATGKIKLKAYGVDLVTDVLNLGVAELLSSVGYGYYDADVTNTLQFGSLGAKKSFSEDGHGLRLGFGAQVNPTPSIGIRAMFRYILTDLDSVKNMKEFTLGIRYYF